MAFMMGQEPLLFYICRHVGMLVSSHSIHSSPPKSDIMYTRGPGPFPGSPCRPYTMDHTSSPVKGYGPCPPPPPAPPPAPFGEFEV
ncbi:inverted formin-2-like [Hyaena hyaena]|uniref:inverted formin-2-like n=1 Tax=Hyaena hyaena TaxID=95912 RepID=UPI00192491AA|nr:inverted formin-2-like [Hyaena hyaena]